jgi:hypothetical protein
MTQVVAIQLRSEHPPHRLHVLAVHLSPADVELLAVKDGHPYRARVWQVQPFGQRIEGRPIQGGVIESSQSVGLATAEGGTELQHAVALPSGQAIQHVLQQAAQAAGQVSGGEKVGRLTIDAGHVAVASHQRPQVNGVGSHGSIACLHVGM